MSAALIGQRVLWCTGQKMIAYYQAYQDVREREWKLLHGVYALVEDRGVAGDEVAHPDHKSRQTTCTETYAQVLLIDLANPGKLTPRQIELISIWLERWTPKVSIGRTPAAAGEGVAPLTVDLSAAAGASRRTPEGDTTRVLDIHELGSSVRKRVGLLRKGETPAALGLGEDVTAPLAESLLTMLYRRACTHAAAQAARHRCARGWPPYTTSSPAARSRSAEAPQKYPRCSTSKLRPSGASPRATRMNPAPRRISLSRPGRSRTRVPPGCALRESILRQARA